MLVNPFAVKVVSHAGQFDMSLLGLVAHEQQDNVGRAKPEAVGRYR